MDKIYFAPDDINNAGKFSLQLIGNLDNGNHTIELKAVDDREIVLDAFYVFTAQIN